MADPGIGKGGGGGGGGGHRRGCGKGWGEVVGRATLGRVREGCQGAGGYTPPIQLGGVGKRCKLPHRGLRWRPRSQRFLHRTPPPPPPKVRNYRFEAGEQQIKSSVSMCSMRQCIADDSTCTELV